MFFLRSTVSFCLKIKTYLSQMSPFNFELFPLARSLVNQVLCSKALTVIKKVKEIWLINIKFCNFMIWSPNQPKETPHVTLRRPKEIPRKHPGSTQEALFFKVNNPVV